MKNRLGLLWYNLMIPYKNWRIRKMWRADPDRPSHCPQLAPISWATLQRVAKEQVISDYT